MCGGTDVGGGFGLGLSVRSKSQVGMVGVLGWRVRWARDRGASMGEYGLGGGPGGRPRWVRRAAVERCMEEEPSRLDEGERSGEWGPSENQLGSLEKGIALRQ